MGGNLPKATPGLDTGVVLTGVLGMDQQADIVARIGRALVSNGFQWSMVSPETFCHAVSAGLAAQDAGVHQYANLRSETIEHELGAGFADIAAARRGNTCKAP